jgi:predicted NAD-dependent protein-ADP-ribosyltransferase YbiA (DUF1768 family)
LRAVVNFGRRFLVPWRFMAYVKISVEPDAALARGINMATTPKPSKILGRVGFEKIRLCPLKASVVVDTEMKYCI